MLISLHQTHLERANYRKRFDSILATLRTSKSGELHVFPELAFCGYPAQDLLISASYWKEYIKEFDRFQQELRENPLPDGTYALAGGAEYLLEDGELDRIHNAAYLIQRESCDVIHRKQLLPNYDIFDEQKYFTPGPKADIVEIEGLRLGVLICEDMWSSEQYKEDPCSDLAKLCQDQGSGLNAIINLSASPYHVGKPELRLARANELAQAFQAPFLYCNQVGGEDEILFDGRSFACHPDQTNPSVANACSPDILQYELTNSQGPVPQIPGRVSSSWESLFSPRVTLERASYQEPTDRELLEIAQTLKMGLQDYAAKTGHNHFLIALSGGIDSALVLTLVQQSLVAGQSVEAIYMPSKFSAKLSWELSAQLCENLGVKLKTLPIKFLHSTVQQTYQQAFQAPLVGLADENIQSRLRGALLYAHSNQTGRLVINTSNKSELAVGYSTLYGDSVGAISMLGDLYKTEVFALSRAINREQEIIPNGIIERPPSAELRENQQDDQSLPPYSTLDFILELLVSYRYSCEEIVQMGIDSEVVRKVARLYAFSEYKRGQFCPILKVKAKSFGFGYRMPITKHISD